MEEYLQTSRFIWYMGALGDPYALLLRGQEDPYELFEQVRARGPLHLSRLGTWVSADHALGNKILRDGRFGTRRADGARVAPQFSSLDDSFLKLDPPDHTRLRRLSIPLFSPKMMAGYRPHVEHVCNELLDRLDLEGGFDLVQDFAKHLPIALIRGLLGIPEEYREKFDRCCHGSALVLEGFVSPEQTEELQLAVDGLYEVFSDMMELRAADPGEDVISRLVAAEREGLLTRSESIGVCGIIAVAGTETTTNLVANGTLALLDRPEQWDLLRENPDLAPGVVEETLRWDSPAQLATRVAHAEVEIAGQTLPEGSLVAILTAAANRDPAVFKDPDVFDITRNSKTEHLAFSGGPHYCLGAPLARMEGDVAFRTLVDRLPQLRQTGPVDRWVSASARGLRHFPVAAR
ncbi:cytochrome P450 [Kitasatospora sp. NBC_01266]|uniref:cytochrome P450 n=1 Tax=Kitasatospora sp. NBC_01266 TaxID=2903572 RepID=UPI002E34A19C|nr:cytochrome P450 [Kitasatospora sp. NBC_01266]